MNLSGQRVTIMGLGCHGGGVAAARFVAEQGADVTVTDRAKPQTLGDSLERLADVLPAGATCRTIGVRGNLS